MMRKKDTQDVLGSAAAVIADALAVWGGFLLATWVRFDSGWVTVLFGRDPDLYAKYSKGAMAAAFLFFWVFRRLDLYVRPQLGRFENKIPRIVRACGLGIVATTLLAFAVRKVYAEFSTVVLAIAFAAVIVLVALERYVLFRIELHYARHGRAVNRVLILGADEVAGRLLRGFSRDPKLRTEVVGLLRTDLAEPHPSVPGDRVLGKVEELASLVGTLPQVDQLILTNSSLGHHRIIEIILFCEQNLIRFNLVPDLFSVLTGSMDVFSIDDIPLLGVSRWPLDRFWGRLAKRIEDIVVAAFGLVAAAPAIAAAAILIKRCSPGPVFYSQERCGEGGRVFTLYKLRTMRADAEARTGPVWTEEDDPRRTPIGAFLRRHNLDELPQLWNVLRGDMSIVGPRPERPHFVERFKTDIGRYMWRHVSKPGLTGWAQVKGLRGNTSIEERVKYDLYYLENWSLAFDFKIMLKTVFARENAY
ncbi:MAG: exopolysaccharide biosynthesis polyprenyl glycosylphosphotransferase [Verrucomicrobiota bacterium]|nr:exopolysaccharide biosynthesis polyprenyl glycosylphosphotransferase [Verrucomicrobiota bacterium]